MYRLGLRLTLSSGREAFTRLMVTMAAVAVGVTIMLAVLADFNAFQVTNDRPAWEATQARQTGQANASDANAELWNYSVSVFKGQTIEQLDVAPLGPQAPIPPGISHLPGSGQYYVSSALAALLRSTPADELGDRFPGTQIGTIGDEALTGPNDLVVYVGYQPAQLAALASTITVDKIADGPQTSVWTNYFRYAFGVGALAFLFPILILIGTATRLAATRREERYAALRLVGATRHQINVIASVDAIVSALFGTILGIGLFALLRPALADLSLTGSKYFSYAVTPTVKGYVAMLVCVPLASAIASLLALRRVRISPLGVSRKQTPPKPRFVRMIPLLLGIALFVGGIVTTTPEQIGVGTYPGLLIIMIGLVVGGPWLTAQAARLMARTASGAPALLAARRLADNPKAAYRSVSGIVLAVFLGTLLAGLLPAINATTATPTATALSNVLLDSFTYAPVCGNEVNCTGGGPGPSQGQGTVAPDSPAVIANLGLPPATGATLVRELQGIQGATVIPIYSMPQDAARAPKPGSNGSGAANGNAGNGPGNGGNGRNTGGPGPGLVPYNSIVSCVGLQELAVLGQCPSGAAALEANTSGLSSDNPSDSTEAIVDQHSPVVSDDFSALYLQAVMVKAANPTSLEIVRTYLATHTPLSESGAAPRTFGEAIQARENVASILQGIVNVAVALTLLVAGCSLAVAVGGSLIERKRPFSLLRLTGTPTAALYKVVLLEAVFPLVAATLAAAVTAYLISVLTVEKLGQPGTPIPILGHVYYLTVGTGLVVSLAVILATLPFLGRITKPESARFE